MATLAAANVVGVLSGWPVWTGDVAPFLGSDAPRAAPSIVNAAALRLPILRAAGAPRDEAVTADG